MHLFRYINIISNRLLLENLSFDWIQSEAKKKKSTRLIRLLIHPIMTHKWFNFLPTSLTWLSFFSGSPFFSFSFLLYLILHNFMRALCRKTRFKQIVCVHTNDTCEELCVCIHGLFFLLLFSSLIKLYLHIPVWIRSSPLRQRGKKSFWFQSIHIDRREKKKYFASVLSLFNRNTGMC